MKCELCGEELGYCTTITNYLDHMNFKHWLPEILQEKKGIEKK